MEVLLTTPEGNSVFACDLESHGTGRWGTDNVIGYRTEQLSKDLSDDVLILEPSVVQWMKALSVAAGETCEKGSHQCLRRLID